VIQSVGVNYYSDFFKTQANVVFLGFLSTILLTFGCLSRDRLPHVDSIVLCEGSKVSLPFQKNVIDEALGRSLQKFHKRATRLIDWIMSSVFIQGHSAFSIPYNVLEIYKLLTSSYRPTLRYTVIMIALPLLIHSARCIFHIAIQFIYLILFLNVQQRYYCSRIDGIFRKGFSKRKLIRRSYAECMTVMRAVLNLSQDLGAFNKFYSKYITFILILYGTVGCSVMNAVSRNPQNESLFLLIPWTFFAILYLINVIFFAHIGSGTVLLNMLSFKRLRRLQTNLLSTFNVLRTSQVIKLDLVNEYQFLLKKTSFRLLNSSTLNNKLLAFQIVPYVSAVYMKLLSEQ